MSVCLPFDEVKLRCDVMQFEVVVQFWKVEREEIFVSVEVRSHLDAGNVCINKV